MKCTFKVAKNFKWTITRDDEAMDVLFGIIKTDKDGVRVFSFIFLCFQFSFGYVRKSK